MAKASSIACALALFVLACAPAAPAPQALDQPMDTPLQKYMCMVDGLNLVTNNSGQNTHEGGVVAMMTGVNALGKIGQQDWAAGGCDPGAGGGQDIGTLVAGRVWQGDVVMLRGHLPGFTWEVESIQSFGSKRL